MSAVSFSPIQPMPYPGDFSSHTVQPQSGNASKGVSSEKQGGPTAEVHQRLERLFAFLKDLNERLYHEPVELLVQACEEEGVEHLLELKELDLCHCKLQKVPDEVGLLTNLRSLRLINNRLESLPLSLLPLAGNLRSLEFEANQLTKIPDVVREIAMQRMERKEPFALFLRNNPMKDVPRSLKHIIRTTPCSDTYYTDE